MKCSNCHYEATCKIPKEKRTNCKGYTPKEEGLILGMTWEEISNKQQRK